MAQLQPHLCPIKVGRDRELSAARRLLSGAARGTGTILLVSGEAGIGKSRLARALTGAAGDEGFCVLEGACDERDRDLPFAVFIDCLCQELHGGGGRIGQLLGKDVDPFARLLPELRPPGPERSTTAAEQEKRRIFEAFADLFVGLSRERPLLLLLEDLHWADETSLELLRLLPRWVASASVLILATARSDEPEGPLDHWLASMERRRLLTRLELSPLNGAEIARMRGLASRSSLHASPNATWLVFRVVESKVSASVRQKCRPGWTGGGTSRACGRRVPAPALPGSGPNGRRKDPRPPSQPGAPRAPAKRIGVVGRNIPPGGGRCQNYARWSSWSRERPLCYRTGYGSMQSN